VVRRRLIGRGNLDEGRLLALSRKERDRDRHGVWQFRLRRIRCDGRDEIWRGWVTTGGETGEPSKPILLNLARTTLSEYAAENRNSESFEGAASLKCVTRG